MRRIVVAALILAMIACISGITLVAADEKSMMGIREQLKLQKDTLTSMRNIIKTESGGSATSYILKTDAGNMTVVVWTDVSGNKLTEYMDSDGNLVKSVFILAGSTEMLVTIYNPEDQSIESESYVNTRTSQGIEVIYNSDGTSQEVLHNLGTGEALILDVNAQGDLINPPVYEPEGGGTTFCSNTGKFELNEQ